MDDDAGALSRQAEAWVDRGDPGEALALSDRAAALDPQGGAPLAARARALRALGRPVEALAALDALARRWPGAAPALDARGVLLAEAGRLEEARAAFAAALAVDPAFARAHFGLATLGRVAPAHLAAMEALARDPRSLDEAGRLHLLYALAKGYDEAGDVRRAFAAAEAGADLRRRRWRGDAGAERTRLVQAAPARATRAPSLREGRNFAPFGVRPPSLVRAGGGGLPRFRPLAGGPGPFGESRAGDQLVFLFGLPRSGTTLVEQILANHADVFTLGETESLAREAGRCDDPAGLARAYRAALPAAARGARRVVDKSLGSALHLGAIRAAFPRARLVYVRRDPLDVGISCHFTLFQHDLPFPPDLEAFGRYARAHAAMMDGWERALAPDVWRRVGYEALVARPEREAQALLDFVGLDWRPQCLDFAGREREIRTASLAQAREAPHVRSVGRWRRYAAFLAPLRRGLEGRAT